MSKFRPDDKVVFSTDRLFYGYITKDSVFNVLEVVEDKETSTWMVSLKEEGQHIFFDEDHLDLFDDIINLTYKDCNGEIQQLDQFHLHELIDRIHCVQVMIQELLMDHPASGLVGNKFRLASEQLGEAYQQLGKISFKKFGEEK